MPRNNNPVERSGSDVTLGATDGSSTSSPTPRPGTGARQEAKAERRSGLLKAAARIMAERGFHATRLDDIGSAVGISGPALYRHFSSKHDLLTAVLVDVSERLQAGGEKVLDAAPDPESALDSLIAFHVHFAFTETELIGVQDRELLNLEPTAREKVATLQRTYLQLWYETLSRLKPELDDDAVKARCRAAVGMINASRHVVGRRLEDPTRAALPGMCRTALTS